MKRPFLLLFMLLFTRLATAGNPTADGANGYVNYLSGGVAPHATLNGGDQGSFFIGGPGQNTIKGGTGNDTIYAHPDYAGLKGKLVFSFSQAAKGTHGTPSVSISINGQNAVPATPITSVFDSGTQIISVDVAAFASISSVAITVSNATSTDANNFVSVAIESIVIDGVNVDLATGSYSGGGTSPFYAYNANGNVMFPASSFAVISPYVADTSDTIDGGGGVNTVVYRGVSDDYTTAKQANGSWRITSATTAEGPDTLTNIRKLTFTDKTITLN